ncbi:MAG: class I SAM-dependent methyltransferase [Planctomycetota bacterium]|nr:class I SAM-dependent methyltransferase [Planctomycetota bacterium]
MSIYRDHIFPWVIEVEMSRRAMREQRAALLARVSGRILELGFGTGLNLPHYPDHVREIVAVEPNLGMSSVARRRLERSPIRVHARALNPDLTLPFDSGEFDTVVTSWTLCTIPDLGSALREVARVLKPRGRFLYLEHGLSPDKRVQRLQRLLEPVSRRLYDGCHLTRDIAAEVRASPLALDTDERFQLRRTPRFCGTMYRGVAVKR